MDLRNIMNSDAAGSANAPPPPVQKSPSQPSHPPYPSDANTYPPPRDSHPSGYPGPPPPLQRAHTSVDRSSSYSSLQSPYQYQPPAALGPGAQSQRGPSPPPPRPPYGSARDSSYTGPVSYTNAPPPLSPFAQQRSQSIHSVLTPNSPTTQSFHPKESPPAAVSAQSYSAQHFSPQGSLPGTPRGSAAAYPRQTPPSARPQSSGHDSVLNQASSSPWVGPDAQMHMSPTAVPRASRQDSRAPEYPPPRQYSSAGERRESDESVSPKTAYPPGSRQGSTATNSVADSLFHSTENSVQMKESPATLHNSHSHPPAPPHLPSSPSARGSVIHEAPVVEQARPPMKMEPAPEQKPASLQAPKRKRRRFNEPPVWAQMAPRAKGRCPIIPNRCPPIPKHLRDSPQNPWIARQRAVEGPATGKASTPVKVKTEGTPVDNNSPATQKPPEPPQAGSLGPWEPSITGFIPHEEMTKIICDFLFQHVVLRTDAIAAPAGTAAAGQGAIIEVEAKLGQLIDMDRGDRMQLPILTESIVNKDNPRFRTAFESTMTVAQHRAMNNFLNEAVKASLPHVNPTRIPLSYAHKKERDTFYEVSPAELPPIIRQNLNPRHKPKVRVTVDQRTGEVLAKIVKCRIADLDVHSPRTCVDWRVSVNLEIGYEGDVSHLPVVDSRGGRGGDRNKDRMSYRHLAYQVDLTQVARSESKGDFEHELEVEMSAAEIRRQGQLAMAGDSKNQYEELIKGFVDNIRILARAVPP